MEDLKKLTDEELAHYVRTKNKEAYVEIMARYQEKLLRYATYLSHDEMKASDIVQNSFIKAFTYLNSFDKKKKFSTWIYRITHNEAMNEVVKFKNELPILEGVDFASDENAELEYSNKQIQETIKVCLGEIPLIYSEPLELMYLEDKSYEEISDILRIPIGTVGTRINRAKKLMKKVCQTKKI